MNYFEFRRSWGSKTYKNKMKKINKPALIKTMGVFSVLLFSFICLSYILYYFLSDIGFYFGFITGAVVFLFLSFKIGISYVKTVLTEGQKHVLNDYEIKEMEDYYGNDFIEYLKSHGYNFNYNLILISSRIFEQFKKQENKI